MGVEVRVARTLLSDVLKRVGCAVPTSSPMEVLTHVYLATEAGTLRAVGNDLELAVATQCPCNGGFSAPHVVPYRVFQSAVSMLDDDEVCLEEGEGKLIVRAGRVRFTVPEMEADRFPAMDIVTPGNAIHLPADTASRLFGALVTPLNPAARSGTNPVSHTAWVYPLGGALVLFATDSHQAVRAQLVAQYYGEPIPDGTCWQFSSRFVTEARKLLNGTPGAEWMLGVTEGVVTASDGTVVMHARLGAGTPRPLVEVDLMMAKGMAASPWFRVGPAAFSKALRRSMLSEDDNRVDITSGTDGIKLVAQGTAWFEEDLAAEVAPAAMPDRVLTCNADYILGALDVANATEPVGVRWDGGMVGVDIPGAGFAYVVAPIVRGGSL